MPLKRFGRDNAPVESGPEPPVRTNPTMTRATVRDHLIVTYAVPPERVVPHLPEGLVPDRLPNVQGDLTAFVQVTCGLFQSARWAPLPELAGDDFFQVTFRILVRRAVAEPDRDRTENRGGVWVIRTLASTAERHLSRRLVDRSADFARIRLFVDGDPARGRYSLYQVRAEADDGPTNLSITFPEMPTESVPAPFGSLADMTGFLTERPEQFFRMPIPGSAVGYLSLRQDPVTALQGELTAARIAPLIEAKLLTGDEAAAPQSTLLIPSVTLQAYPPRPIRLRTA
ncbi:MAG: DUF2071 domain-containing protein [Capsulimonadales bacterium]|nr:DUF2071 domain-containing protein [Capsulimonadales bacterium]